MIILYLRHNIGNTTKTLKIEHNFSTCTLSAFYIFGILVCSCCFIILWIICKKWIILPLKKICQKIRAWFKNKNSCSENVRYHFVKPSFVLWYFSTINLQYNYHSDRISSSVTATSGSAFTDMKYCFYSE